MLKAGFIGAGFVSHFHRRALSSVRDIQLAGVYRRSTADALAQQARSDGLGDAVVYDSIAELCDAVDVVCVFVPNFARVETFEAILDARRNGADLKGLVCEKPLARNVAEADRIVALADEIGVPTAFFENNLFMPPIVNARAQLKAVEASMGPAHLSRAAEEHAGPAVTYWFWDPTLQGGGVWSDMGCHSVAVAMYMLTPQGKSLDFLEPISTNAELALLKWNKQPWSDHLKRQGIDFAAKPAEDYANVSIKFRDPERNTVCLVQATNSWMFDAAGLRLQMETFGPGYSYTVNSLNSPGEIFVSDTAGATIEDSFQAVENAQSARGRVVLQPNEPDLYGYIGEWRDAVRAFQQGRDATASLRYGRLITMLIMSGYMAHEERRTLDLSDSSTRQALASYIPLIQQGQGASVLP